ncbi:MAG: hypothetical protein PHP70_11820 [Gallionella sp.]|nr:hypothetical protein [Gallionella sp.]
MKMKKNSILWYDSVGKPHRFAAIDTSDAAVDELLRTATALHKTGAAQWAIYFGDKGTQVKQWGISPEQAKVITGVSKPVNQAGNQGATFAEPSCRPLSAVPVLEGWQGLQVTPSRRRGEF